MSDIWSLIKEGKERLNIKKKEETAFDDVSFPSSSNMQDEDILMFDGEKEQVTKPSEGGTQVFLEANQELPEWLTKNDLTEIRHLQKYPIFELHEELVRLEKWLQPTAFDKYIREYVIEDLEKAFKRFNFEAEVFPFGSFLTNL